MLRTKTPHQKLIKTRSKPAESVAKEEDGEAVMIDVVKSKKPLEIEIPEDVIETAIVEEKADDESTVAEDAEEAAADEVTLDDDELNPFGDKWEQ